MTAIVGTMPRIEYQPKWWVATPSGHLRQHRRNVHSQGGEDGIIQMIFSTMAPRHRWCVEFGAWDGINTSNTAHLTCNADPRWGGVLIEGSPERYAQLEANFQGRDDIQKINALVMSSGPDTLDEILAKTKTPIDFDFLSIDIDGNDYHVWNSLKSYRPRLVCIEFNFTIPNDVLYVQDDDPNVFQGSSLRAMVELGRSKGYELICVTHINAFFVVKEEFPIFNIPDNSLDQMNFLEGNETKLFQLYDGTIVIVGNNNLIWHDVPIDPKKMQMLPPEERVFPMKFRT